VAKILVTGGAGFIGFHAALAISNNSAHEVVVVDSLLPISPTELTRTRLNTLRKSEILVIEMDLKAVIGSELSNELGKFDLILHLAAFPGVRITNAQEPLVLENNLLSFETIGNYAIETSARLIYASSSSVYGDSALNSACNEAQIEIFTGKGAYAFSKWKNERRAEFWLKSGALKSIGLRLFSVYGSFGREDMAYFKFAKLMSGKKPITVFGSLNDHRDYTPISLVINDILEMVDLFLADSSVLEKEFFSPSSLPILNIGSGNPKSLQDIIVLYEDFFKRKADIVNLERLAIESRKTWSDNEKRNRILKERKNESFESSITSFLQWFEEFEKANG
jgi:UDP-glucuronate 4-epimerase